MGGVIEPPVLAGPRVVTERTSFGAPCLLIAWDPSELDVLRSVGGAPGPDVGHGVAGGPVDQPSSVGTAASPRQTVVPGRGEEQVARPPAAGSHVASLPASSTPQQEAHRRPEDCWVAVLGPVVVEGWLVEPDRRAVTELLCYLSLHPGRPVPADEIRAAMWPGDGLSGEASGRSLRNTASLLRRCLGPERFPEAERGAGYRLGPGISTDWGRFEELVQASAAAGSRQTDVLEDALALVRGAPFEGVPSGSYGWAWSELLVSRMEVAITDAAQRLVMHSLLADACDRAEWAALATRYGLRPWWLTTPGVRSEGPSPEYVMGAAVDARGSKEVGPSSTDLLGASTASHDLVVSWSEEVDDYGA